jgi:CheY-like chemotaxis protein
MDIQMPHMDGLTAIRQIRISTDPAVAQTPIIALTALAMRGDRERCLSAGADEYLSKPFTMRALAEMIRTLLDTSNQNLK